LFDYNKEEIIKAKVSKIKVIFESKSILLLLFAISNHTSYHYIIFGYDRIKG